MGGGLLTVQTALNLAYNECYWTAEFGELCRLFGELTVGVDSSGASPLGTATRISNGHAESRR